MHGIYQFLKSTVVGGLVVLVPVVVLGYIVLEAVNISRKALAPVLEWLPVKSVAGVSLGLLLAILFLILACFLAGLLAETTLVRAVISSAERFILSNIPGYALMKNVGEQLVGVEGKQSRRTVLVRFEVSCQLGIQMDTLPDGRCVVFVPGVPHSFSGELHIVHADRVEALDLSIAKTLEALSRLGVGLHEVWPKQPPAGGLH